MRRSWGKSGKSMVFQWWYCMSHQYLASSKTDPIYKIPLQLLLTSFIFCLIIWCHCWSDTKIMNRLRHITFRYSYIGGVAEISFFLIGVLMFSSWWWWQEQNPLFTDVEHAGLVWASCVVFFLTFFPFLNISGMHLNHLAVLLSYYEPLC